MVTIEACTAMRMLGFRSLFITLRAEGYLVLGRFAEAREQAEQAVALACAQQEGGWEAWALKLLGDVHAHEPVEVEQRGVDQSGGRAGRGRAYRQALAAATEMGMRPLVAHCHFGLGTLYASPHPQPLSRSGERVAKTGQREEIREHLATATTLYRELGMWFWLEQAEAALNEVGVG